MSHDHFIPDAPVDAQANRFEDAESENRRAYLECQKDYPSILEELKRREFNDVLGLGGCSLAVLDLLARQFPDKTFTGIGKIPNSIDATSSQNLPNARFVHGNFEDLQLPDNAFDAVVSAISFHQYSDPKKLFEFVFRVLRPDGRLILRDYTSNDILVWIMNHIHRPISILRGNGDFRICTLAEMGEYCKQAGMKLIKLEQQKNMRMHLVAIKKVPYVGNPWKAGIRRP